MNVVYLSNSLYHRPWPVRMVSTRVQIRRSCGPSEGWLWETKTQVRKHNGYTSALAVSVSWTQGSSTMTSVDRPPLKVPQIAMCVLCTCGCTALCANRKHTSYAGSQPLWCGGREGIRLRTVWGTVDIANIVNGHASLVRSCGLFLCWIWKWNCITTSVSYYYAICLSLFLCLICTTFPWSEAVLWKHFP